MTALGNWKSAGCIHRDEIGPKFAGVALAEDEKDENGKTLERIEDAKEVGKNQTGVVPPDTEKAENPGQSEKKKDAET